MVSVAKGLNAPVKILFPKALNVRSFSQLVFSHAPFSGF